MTYTKKEREQYNIRRDRACAKLRITKNQYNFLRRQGEKLRKAYELICNGYEQKTEGMESLIVDYAKGLGLQVYLQTDPRGATIYLNTESIPENKYTQAVCIY